MPNLVSSATSLEGHQSTNGPITNWFIMWRFKYAKEATQDEEDDTYNQCVFPFCLCLKADLQVDGIDEWFDGFLDLVNEKGA